MEPMMALRPYQVGALEAVRQSLRDGTKRPLVCLPTGSGKSPVICALIHILQSVRPGEKFLVLVHTQELVAQLASTYQRNSGIPPAIYSASLGRKEIDVVTFGQIQSVYRKATDIGAVSLIVIDECDRLPVEGMGQYRRFLSEMEVINPNVRIVGFTATPYRLGAGLVYGEDRPFNAMVYDAPIRELINQGYLSKLASKDGGAPNIEGVHVRNGDYVATELETAMCDERTVENTCDELCRYGHNRKAWLLFCSGVKHANMVTTALAKRGIEAPTIEGNTNDADRKGLIERFKTGSLRALVNINVLSVGFDAPHVDLIGMLRPTKSPGLYYQQVGRGLRRAEGKTDCLVLDFAGNIAEHGPIDTLNDRIKQAKSAKGKGKAPTKTCEKCKEIVHASTRVCPACGHRFPDPRLAKHAQIASEASPLAEAKWIDVTTVRYSTHVSKDPTKPPTIQVVYMCGIMPVREWWSLDVQANSYARGKCLLAIAQTPKQLANGRSLTIAGNKILGHHNGDELEISTALAMLPYCDCLVRPAAIQVQPDPKNPQYLRITGRRYPTSSTQEGAA